MKNLQVVLGRRPSGAPVPEDFELFAAPMPVPGEDDVLVRTTYLSVDPALRPRMNAVSAYAGPVAIGAVIPSPALGVVIRSLSPHFRPGDHVTGFFGWQAYAVVPADGLRQIDIDRAPEPKWLSLLGLSAFTAYVGVAELGRPRPGETLVVSAAAGATGAVAGQIARIFGARSVGIAGGPEKCAHVVDELGFDACLDYRAPDFVERLDAACPAGIDVDFENVGGDVLRAVFDRMNVAGRVILCGLVAEYNSDQWAAGPSLWPAVYKSLRIEGFRASRHFDRIPEFVDKALAWAAEGRLRQSEHIVEGLANAPAAFCQMLAGRHLGKVMVRVEENL
ncbi:MAG: NADP-dependent oxidoreductase [Alphaproteobacteria bacterium]|nr:MAG: NADP-dependent oxidoreductase [Alphaproteobacteria bacterium]